MNEFDFNGLFVYDLANNHQGDVKHGIKIIKAMGDVTKKGNVKGCLKFQFRQLDTFIHPEFKDKKDIPHIPRFISTSLSRSDYEILTKETRKQKLTTISTPFDEKSVDMILEMDIEIIKVASCSACDRPLIEKIAETGRPIIVSTAGLSLDKIDKLVSFLEYKNVQFALMHCVALYPTEKDKLCLNQIELLKNRFPNITIGFSTHEDPDNYIAVQLAYAKGAKLFERHVGIQTNDYKLNAYSSNPDQIAKWIESYCDAKQSCGGDERAPSSVKEKESLNSLMRGVFAKKAIKKGNVINRNDVFFAMPLLKDQLISGEWYKGLIADKDYASNKPLRRSLAKHEYSNEETIYRIMLQVKGMLNNARIFIGKESDIEISHHYGLERLREFGAIIVNCINREYCKKLVVQLPRQKHPVHYHEKKEETFQLLSGDLEIVLDGYKHKLTPGNCILVKPGQWHKFHTLDGAIIEEVSTTHYNDDSFYEDEKIAQLPREMRKTEMPNWEAALEE